MSAETGSDRRKAGVMERHIQTAIQVLLVALIIGVFKTGLEILDTSAKNAEQISSIQNKVAEINERQERYLLRTEADVRFREQESKHIEIDRRLNNLELSRGAR